MYWTKREGISKNHVKFPQILGESDPKLYFKKRAKVKVKVITVEFE